MKTKQTAVAQTAQTYGRSLLQEAWQRFRKNRLATICLVLMGVLTVIALSTVAIDLITQNQFYDEYVIGQDLVHKLKPPSLQHVFGQDEFGQDIFLRVLWGTRYSLFMGMFSITISVIVGGVLGAIAGYYSKLTDNIIMRCMDILMAIPSILLAIAIVAALGSGLTNVLIAISVSYVPTFARVVRAAVMTVRDQEFVEAAHAIGASDFEIIFKQIIPNAIAPIIVQATLGVASAILSIAALSFLGLGIKPPIPEWGAMLSSARVYIRDAWHITFFPGMMIVITILILNIVGDGIRDALDPKMKS